MLSSLSCIVNAFLPFSVLPRNPTLTPPRVTRQGREELCPQTRIKQQHGGPARAGSCPHPAARAPQGEKPIHNQLCGPCLSPNHHNHDQYGHNCLQLVVCVYAALRQSEDLSVLRLRTVRLYPCTVPGYAWHFQPANQLGSGLLCRRNSPLVRLHCRVV